MFAKTLLTAGLLAAPAAFALEERAGGRPVVYAGAPISNITVQANNVVQCSQASVSWTGAVDPVTLYIAIGGFYIGDRPIETRSDVYGGSADWLVNVKAGESLHFRVTDANNQVAYVQGIQVQQGDSWCLDAGSSSSASPAGTSGSPSPSPSPAPSADGGSGGTESQGSPATTSSRSTGSRLSRSSSSAQATQAAGEQASSADESSASVVASSASSGATASSRSASSVSSSGSASRSSSSSSSVASAGANAPPSSAASPNGRVSALTGFMGAAVVALGLTL